MDTNRRSRAARDRSEEALIRFGLLAGEHACDFVVIGGLNPDFLAPHAPVPHLGTTDVDLLFELGFAFDRDELDFAWLEDALTRGGFRPRGGSSGWQWDAVLGESLVRLDLLCDQVDSPGQALVLPGADAAAVQNLAGPAAALVHPVERELPVPSAVRQDFPDAPSTIRLRFATLGGYIIAKAAALESRRKPKDAYDLMYVVLFNDGGVQAAVEAVTATPLPPYRQPHFDVTRRAFQKLASARGEWAGYFAQQMIDAGDDEDEAVLRQDAAAGARRFLDLFATPG